jgi:hypothetical protein
MGVMGLKPVRLIKLVIQASVMIMPVHLIVSELAGDLTVAAAFARQEAVLLGKLAPQAPVLIVLTVLEQFAGGMTVAAAFVRREAVLQAGLVLEGSVKLHLHCQFLTTRVVPHARVYAASLPWEDNAEQVVLVRPIAILAAVVFRIHPVKAGTAALACRRHSFPVLPVLTA